jgi:hypothetical protein
MQVSWRLFSYSDVKLKVVLKLSTSRAAELKNRRARESYQDERTVKTASEEPARSERHCIPVQKKNKVSLFSFRFQSEASKTGRFHRNFRWIHISSLIIASLAYQQGAFRVTKRACREIRIPWIYRGLRVSIRLLARSNSGNKFLGIELQVPYASESCNEKYEFLKPDAFPRKASSLRDASLILKIPQISLILVNRSLRPRGSYRTSLLAPQNGAKARFATVWRETIARFRWKRGIPSRPPHGIPGYAVDPRSGIRSPGERGEVLLSSPPFRSIVSSVGKSFARSLARLPRSALQFPR